MSAIEFEGWPKIARLNRDIVVTEKIDGTNAAVVIYPLAGTPEAEGREYTLDNALPGGDAQARLFDNDAAKVVARVGNWVVFAQSRTRFITPGNDNYGFAAWVKDNASSLVSDLGYGRHFGEWWGAGVQRGYGMPKGQRFFSLFNTERYQGPFDTDNLRTVPVLYVGPYDMWDQYTELDMLSEDGSCAAGDEGVNGQKAEGIVIYHTAARTAFKVTLEGDAAPKGLTAHVKDEEVR